MWPGDSRTERTFNQRLSHFQHFQASWIFCGHNEVDIKCTPCALVMHSDVEQRVGNSQPACPSSEKKQKWKRFSVFDGLRKSKRFSLFRFTFTLRHDNPYIQTQTTIDFDLYYIIRKWRISSHGVLWLSFLSCAFHALRLWQKQATCDYDV